MSALRLLSAIWLLAGCGDEMPPQTAPASVAAPAPVMQSRQHECFTRCVGSPKCKN